MGMARATVGTVQPWVSRHQGSRTSVAGQLKAQRRRYAHAVVQSLARSNRGRPAARVRKVPKNSLTPLGVRLSPARLPSSRPTSLPGAP